MTSPKSCPTTSRHLPEPVKKLLEKTNLKVISDPNYQLCTRIKKILVPRDELGTKKDCCRGKRVVVVKVFPVKIGLTIISTSRSIVDRCVISKAIGMNVC